MRRASSSSRYGGRALKTLVGLAFLTALACDNSMSFNPVAPEWPDWQGSGAGARTLLIQGTLGIQNGAVLEATVLYDGLEVAGARTRCRNPAGCRQMELEASVLSATGHHTIAFQVLRQSEEVIDYRAEGTVLVSREGVDLGGANLRLGPKQAALEAGGAVTFDIAFSN